MQLEGFYSPCMGLENLAMVLRGNQKNYDPKLSLLGLRPGLRTQNHHIGPLKGIIGLKW